MPHYCAIGVRHSVNTCMLQPVYWSRSWMLWVCFCFSDVHILLHVYCNSLSQSTIELSLTESSILINTMLCLRCYQTPVQGYIGYEEGGSTLHITFVTYDHVYTVLANWIHQLLMLCIACAWHRKQCQVNGSTLFSRCNLHVCIYNQFAHSMHYMFCNEHCQLCRTQL
jgi:hypothetical protein